MKVPLDEVLESTQSPNCHCFQQVYYYFLEVIEKAPVEDCFLKE